MSRFRLAFAPIFLLILTAGGTSPAQTVINSNIDRIEEDWVLTVGTPDLDAAGPQMTTTMSPVGDNSRLFFAFNLNYRDAPFQAGGLQVQGWAGSTKVVSSNSQRTQRCSTSDETITWTQRLSLSGNIMTYDILSSESTTWDKFGQGGNLRLSVASSIVSLDQYDPAVSVKNSGVGWQSNRVTKMTLREVRYYSGGSLVTTDSTARSVSLGNN